MNIIIERFKANNIALTTDYFREMTVLDTQLATASQNAKELAAKAKELSDTLGQQESQYEDTCAELKTKLDKNSINRAECAGHLDKLGKAVKRLQNKADSLNDDERSKNVKQPLSKTNLPVLFNALNVNMSLCSMPSWILRLHVKI